MEEINHLAFIKEPTRNAKLWRYMSFAKFVDIISAQRIHLSKASAFNDPFEVSYPEIGRMYDQLYEEKGISKESWLQNKEKARLLQEEIKKEVFISCWHECEYESAAMWDLYSSKEGVAVKITAGNLLDLQLSLSPELCFVSRVTYINFSGGEWDKVKQTNHSCAPFFYKRKSFEHEREVRMICKKESHPIELDNFFDKIIVHPQSEAWFLDLTKTLVQKFGINESKVMQSKLYELS